MEFSIFGLSLAIVHCRFYTLCVVLFVNFYLKFQSALIFPVRSAGLNLIDIQWHV